jgi:LacI family transcriptional regulator
MARLLDLRMRGRKPESPVVRVAPLRIHEAASTSILAIEDSRLCKAILYLREHACGPISVREVVAESGLSRRALELQMQKVLGCTVHQEITRVRIARAKQLLRSSDLPLAEIALACGLEWASSLCTLFAREVGMPPGRYRAQMRQELRKGTGAVKDDGSA